ncbi:iron chelate uptake ABC transporter family permease subunit [Falsirhodobacter halotolerans]|uniref:iron chelate uptake ABC transporter family permease subunit n=1 Tax=Falsirhodobacter halotolerans TaxID=1146892 RepID=UPI001FCFBAFB|nr:iron chelate uptake ABC transporter family permease subunit [Falsirhodobacter halotolerans]MCJ8139799.1 iron chelate uptake ABC transporter family permease subunit [Falsirhodobacter halotolerans]
MHRPDARARIVLAVLAVLAAAAIVAFMTLGVRGNWGFVLGFRGTKVLGLILVAWSIALSTVLFQTVTGNRILTPSIMGFDALFILIRTGVTFFFGFGALALMSPKVQFGAEVLVMTGFAVFLFQWLFLRAQRSLHLMVLVGIVFGVLFRNLAGFMQRLMDPVQFQTLQDMFFASFSRIDPTLLGVSTVIVGAASLVTWRIAHSFDVLMLGREQAISLGVPYRRRVATILAIVAVLVSVATALVGPVTFFGLLVVSLAHVLCGSGRHRHVLPAAVLLGIICLVGGQTLLERVFAFDTALSIIIEFLGGLVFILLLVRGAAR